MDKIIPITIFIVLCLAGWGIWKWLEKKRREAIERVGGELGLDYELNGHGQVGELIGRFHLMKYGRRRRVRNLLHGPIHDLHAFIFDYQYTTGGGKSSSTNRQSVVALQAASGSLPRFVLQPEHIFHKIGSVVGFDDIDFDSHPEFSKRIRLTGDDEPALRTLFTEDLLDFFEGCGRLCVEGDGEWILVYRVRKRTKPDLLPGLLEEAFDIFTRLA